jgi:CubicO group peptidase (beta-lactamase class C family)
MLRKLLLGLVGAALLGPNGATWAAAATGIDPARPSAPREVEFSVSLYLPSSPPPLPTTAFFKPLPRTRYESDGREARVTVPAALWDRILQRIYGGRARRGRDAYVAGSTSDYVFRIDAGSGKVSGRFDYQVRRGDKVLDVAHIVDTEMTAGSRTGYFADRFCAIASEDCVLHSTQRYDAANGTAMLNGVIDGGKDRRYTQEWFRLRDRAPAVPAQAPSPALPLAWIGSGDALDHTTLRGVVVAPDGTAFAVGTGASDLFGEPARQIVLVAYTGEGVQRWSKRWQGDGIEQAYKIDRAADGRIAICGIFQRHLALDGHELRSRSDAPAAFAAVLKDDGSVQRAWVVAEQHAGTSLFEQRLPPVVASECRFTPDGDLIVAGSFGGLETDPVRIRFETRDERQARSRFDAFVARYRASGELRWLARTEGLSARAHNFARALAIADDGSNDVLIGGRFEGRLRLQSQHVETRDSNAGWVARIDGETGKLRWLSALEGSGPTEVRSIATRRQRVFVGGKFVAPLRWVDRKGVARVLAGTGSVDLLLAELDVQGRLRDAESYGSGGPDEGLELAIDAGGAIAMAGAYSESLDGGGLSGVPEGGSDGLLVVRGPNGRALAVGAGGERDDFLYSVAADPRGGFVAVGSHAGQVRIGGAVAAQRPGALIFRVHEGSHATAMTAAVGDTSVEQLLSEDHRRHGEPIWFAAVRAGQVRKSVTQGAIDDRKPTLVASMTKWVTTAAILAESDRNPKLPLSLRIVDAMPEFAAAATVADRSWREATTLRHLLALQYDVDEGASRRADFDRNVSLRASAAAIAALPLRSAPGARFRYGGDPFKLAGVIALDAFAARTGDADANFEDMVHELIAKPLAFEDEWSYCAHGACTRDGNRALGGGLRISPRDYAKFVAMLARGGRSGIGQRSTEVLRADTVREMFRSQFAPNMDRGNASEAFPGAALAGYGLGTWIERADANGQGLRVSCPGAFGGYPWVEPTRASGGVLVVEGDWGSLRKHFATAQRLIGLDLDVLP